MQRCLNCKPGSSRVQGAEGKPQFSFFHLDKHHFIHVSSFPGSLKERLTSNRILFCQLTDVAGTQRQRRSVFTCASNRPSEPVQNTDNSEDIMNDTQPFAHHYNNAGLTDAELESLDVLEWPSVSRQVARLCGTVMAAQSLASGGVMLGKTMEDSQALLQQTQEAFDLNLTVSGVYDLSPALEAVEANGVLNSKQLEGVAASLEAALSIYEAVSEKNDDGSPKWPSLMDLAAGIDSKEESIAVKAIRHCIRLGSVSDAASEKLAAVRAERRDNADKLRVMMNDIARGLFEKGASDSRNVTIMRDRSCVGIKAGRQSDLPKGSVKLGSSQTGATMYYEPAPAIPLNNNATMLKGKEEEEEFKVLVLLSQLIASRAAAIRSMLDAIVKLDVAASRAKHARIFGGVRPQLVEPSQLHSSAASPSQVSGMYVPGARHPLLFERALPEPLPEPPSLDDNRFDRNFQPPPMWEQRRSSVNGGAIGGANSPSSSPSSPTRAPPPKALDLRLPAGKQVIAVTGPNTGGKTVTLKTIGLMALMAKAGMYVPQELHNQGSSPCVGWFSRVLADIGDAQSLQQNLSTFSGHIRRLKQVLAAADTCSLVLLDEVGSGTDPVEGAALARAILDKLAGKAALTVATTHHAELKQVDREDPRYSNVSMEFDTISLRPTYRLMWGQVGASNALDIARTLGFDSTIVKEAEIIARTTFEYQADREARMAATAQALVKQLEDTRLQLQEEQQRRDDSQQEEQTLEDRILEAQKLMEQLERLPRKIVQRRDKVRMQLDAAITAYEGGFGTRQEVDVILKSVEQEVERKIKQVERQQELVTAQADVGDRVVVPSIHGEDTFFTVVSISGGVATLRPESVLGVGLQLYAMKSSRNRDKKGSSIRAAVSEVRVVQRRADLEQEQQQGAVDVGALQAF